MKFKLSTILTILIFSISIFSASPGAIDYSFGNNGKLLTPNSNQFQNGFRNQIFVLPDGKFIASGILNGGIQFCFYKYNQDATLDTTFGTIGTQCFNLFSLERTPDLSFVMQSDGKIVLVSRLDTSGTNSLIVRRFNSDGTLDSTFDGDGTAFLTLFGINQGISNVEIASSGKIVVFGSSQNVDCTVSRFNSNGSPDTAFGTGGKQLVDLLGATNQSCSGTLENEDANRIIVTSTVANIGAIGVARLTSNGSFDTSFDSDGVATVTFSAGFASPHSVNYINGNQLRVLGRSGSAGTSDKSVMAQFNIDGTLNTSFGSGGKVELINDSTLSESFDTIRELPNGQFFAKTTIGSNTAFAKFNSNGSLDNSFGLNGIFKLNDFARLDFDLQKDGKLLSVGTQNPSHLISRHINSIQPSPSSDFDGDGFTDTAVFRPSTGNWFIVRSSDNTFSAYQFGVNGDVPIDGDFDGDGKNDAAIFRPSNGQWWLQRSSDNTSFAVQFGTGTDKPIPGDYDKDGKTDIAVFRPSTGEWLVLRSSTNFSTFFGFQFGLNGDIPVSSERK